MKVTYLNERLVSTCDVRSGNTRPYAIVAVAYTHLAPALDLPRQKFKNEVPWLQELGCQVNRYLMTNLSSWHVFDDAWEM
jgi:hypothetical protein